MIARLRRRPALAAEAAVVLAWALLLAAALTGHQSGLDHAGDGAGGHGSGAAHGAGAAGHGSGAADATPTDAVALLLLLLLMAIAMMVPGTLPAVRHVACNSFRWRRGRAVGTFVTVYLGVWVVAGIAGLALAEQLPSTPLAFAAALLVAAAWQVTPWKRRALERCHRPVPLPPRGARAYAGAARFGILNGTACVASCWALMLAMLLAPAAHLVWMAGLTLLVTFEKSALRPRRTVHRFAGGLAACGGAVLIAGLSV